MNNKPDGLNRNVLILSWDFPPDIGGIHTYSYELAKNLSKNGVEVFVLTRKMEKDEMFDKN